MRRASEERERTRESRAERRERTRNGAKGRRKQNLQIVTGSVVQEFGHDVTALRLQPVWQWSQGRPMGGAEQDTPPQREADVLVLEKGHFLDDGDHVAQQRPSYL
jgi:hypothetical protein